MNVADSQVSSETPHRRCFRYSLRTLLLVVLLVSVLLSAAMVIVRIASRRQEANRLQATRDSFMLTEWSLDAYDERYRHLPFPVRRETIGKPTKLGTPNGTGKPLYSWRAEVACYRDNWCREVLDTSATWDSPLNKQFADFPWQFCYDALVTWECPRNYSKMTSMMALTGPGTGFGCEEEPPRRLVEVPENTILVVEVRNSGVHWMQPGDLDIRTMPHTRNAADGRGISSRYPGGFHVMFADLSTWFLSDAVPFDVLAKFFTIEGGKQNDREALLGPYVLWRTPKRRPLSACFQPSSTGFVEFDRRVNDADLRELELSQFANTRELWLPETQVTGPGLAHIRQLVHLEKLFLEGTPLTDEGLAHLADMRQLTWLRLDRTQITDNGLKYLSGLVNLKGLDLCCPNITDAGLEHLKSLTQLEWLSISGTGVTDAAIETFSEFPHLRYLGLCHTGVTDEGVAKLKELPQHPSEISRLP